MKKLVKFVMWMIVLLIALPIAALLLSPLWLGQVAGCAANLVVPQLTGTDFKVEKLRINPYTGVLRVENMRLANPKGYAAEDAVKLDLLYVKVAPLSLISSIIRVNDITLENPYVSYLDHEKTNNFDRIIANVTGDKDESVKEEMEDLREEAKEAPDGDDKRIIIERIKIAGLRVRYAMLTLPIPSLELKNIGSDKGGVTIESAGLEIWESIQRALTSAGGAIGDGVKALGTGAATILKDVGESGKAVKNVGASAAKVTESLGQDAAKAASAVSDGAKKATEAIGNLFK